MITWIKGQCPGQRCPYSADPFGAGYEVEFSEDGLMNPPIGHGTLLEDLIFGH